MIKISVILPVYNVAPYLEQCLDSIVTQDFDDFEVICVYDKSPDNSLDILNKYSEKYACVKVVEREQKNGLSAARNTGMEYAQGKYIWFIDSDDYIVPGAFKKLYECAEQSHADVVVCNFSYSNDKSVNLIKKDIHFPKIEGVKNGLEMMKLQLDFGFVRGVWCLFIKNEYMQKNDLKFYEGILSEDILFYYYVYTSAQRMIELNEKLYVYRQRSDSLVYSKQSENAASLFTVIVNICADWIGKSFSDEDNLTISQFLKKLNLKYQYHKNFQVNYGCTGGFKENCIYDLIYQKTELSFFDEEEICELKNAEHIILYGAGLISEQIIDILKKLNLNCSLIAVSSMEGNPTTKKEISVKCINDITPKAGDVIVIATGKTYHAEISRILVSNGFNKIICPHNV